ncbi:hypothetical protein [Streptomyces sp. NPDC003077]|uniref:hypothetical protein n=1 Tax=Streptomyces sp. NPDC003077 TaxID=3154443 RepID=UPI0033BC11B5
MRERADKQPPLTVTVRYVAVEGSDGQALQQRQTVALHQTLIWLAAHPTTAPRQPSRAGGH